MILDKKLNRNLVALIILISVFLILPLSFASEDTGVDQSHGLPIEDNPINMELSETSTVGQSAVYVNASYESNDGIGTADKPMKTIEKALNLSNNGGTIYLTGKFSGDGNSNITLNKNPNEIRFIGIGGAVVDGKSSSTFAVVKSGSYTFENISFVNHYKSGDDVYGGAITSANGRLTFKNCLFENNSAFGVNKANGGAVDSAGELIIENCVFKNNVVNVSNSSGYRKNAADGGAISNVGALQIYGSSFIANTALRNGGAIRTQDTQKTVSINYCNFTDNVAAYHMSGGSYGGAIYTWDCGLELKNSIFKNNRVYDSSGYGAQGGAISSNRGDGIINILYCQFINNTAGGIRSVNGQSIHVTGVEAYVNYCTIDTSIYSDSLIANFDYNWWNANSENIKEKLVENLPKSASIKTFAELKLSSEFEKLENGEEVSVSVKLCWNGTKNQNNISLIPLRTVHLTSNCGILSQDSGTLDNGLFETKLTLNKIINPIITATVDDASAILDLLKVGPIQTSSQ